MSQEYEMCTTFVICDIIDYINCIKRFDDKRNVEGVKEIEL